jgi:hypothetical protein
MELISKRRRWISVIATLLAFVGFSTLRLKDDVERRRELRFDARFSVKTYFFGCRTSFCTRQFNSSATKITFSDGHAIS